MDDFEMKSCKDERLTPEKHKSILYTCKEAKFPARYHVGEFPGNVLRVWTINPDKFADGSTNWAHWFDREGLPGLAALVDTPDKAEKWFKQAGEHDKAVARRAVVFFVEDDLYVAGSKAVSDEATLAHYLDDLERSRPL
jgi:hypothetical protein